MTSVEKQKWRAKAKGPWKVFSKQFLSEHKTCVICGRKAKLVHHKYLNDDEASYTNLDPIRFAPFCNKCHRFIHSIEGTIHAGKTVVDSRIVAIVSELIIHE